MKHASQVASRKAPGMLAKGAPSRSTTRGTDDQLRQSILLQMLHVKVLKI